MIRSFLAIRLPEPIRKDLESIQERLKETDAPVKWVTPDNVHLTLKFLGNIESKDVEKIHDIVSKIVTKETHLILRGEGVGAFPHIKSPRVIWVGISGEIDRLKDIHIRMEEELETIGFRPEERSFSPHLTIGRVKTGVHKALLDRLIALKDYRSQPFKAGEIILFKSDLRPYGPIHTPLKTIPLGGEMRSKKS